MLNDFQLNACIQCAKPFQPIRRNARFCGDACKHAHARGEPPIEIPDAQAHLDFVSLLNSISNDDGYSSLPVVAKAELKRYFKVRQEAIERRRARKARSPTAEVLPPPEGAVPVDTVAGRPQGPPAA